MFEEINEKYLDALIEKTGNSDFYLAPIDEGAIQHYTSSGRINVAFCYKKIYNASITINTKYSCIDLTIQQDEPNGCRHYINSTRFKFSQEVFEKIVLSLPALIETASTSYKLYIDNMTTELHINDLGDLFTNITV